MTSQELASGVSSNSTTQERGLAFVAYQSQIAEGFRFIQTQWANVPSFAPAKNETPGWDPMIGANQGGSRFMNGYDVQDQSLSLTMLQDLVISRGGEYFFMPSISALLDVISV